MRLIATLTRVMDLLKSVYRRRNSFHPGLELKAQVQGVVARLVQVAPVEPERLLLGGLPHVAQLALPRSGVLGGFRPKTPTLTNLRRNLWRDQIRRPTIH